MEKHVCLGIEEAVSAMLFVISNNRNASGSRIVVNET